jgi:hypothetical protein
VTLHFCHAPRYESGGNEERRQTFTRARRGRSALVPSFAAVLLARLEGPGFVETYAASMPFCSRVSMMCAVPISSRGWKLSPRSARSSKWIGAPVFECAILVARLRLGAAFQLQKRPRKTILAIPGCGGLKTAAMGRRQAFSRARRETLFVRRFGLCRLVDVARFVLTYRASTA